MLSALLMILLLLTSVFLILLVLVQRGRGGGLAGAFGGLGGQSAFGTKAGDLFTRVTIGVAAFWIILCAASVKLLNEGTRGILSPNLGGRSSATAPPAAGGKTTPGDSKPGVTGPKSAPASGASGPQTPSSAPASAPTPEKAQ
jgi:preprotein translocase subunit SecG